MITQEQRDQIIYLWQNKFTGSEIADKLSLTRNAVLGAVHRMRRNGADLEDRKGKTGFKVRKPRPLIIKKPKKTIRAPKIIVKPPEPKLENNINPVNIFELKMNSCRYIVESGDVYTTKYCNQKTHKESYCADHYKICYYPARMQSIPD